MSTPYRKKLIEVALPLEAINAASAREKSIRHGHPSTLHLWWARRPLAAARAVLFSQLVDDPSSWTELFPTEEAQNHERQRLFRLIEDLVLWENSNNETVINAARLEIARSHARSSSSPKAKGVLAEGVTHEVVNEYLATELPPVHDPFAGGGTIPLEAQRLGLRAIATDLNPVAVMINKALIEIPPKFAGKPPVNPDSRANNKLKTWKGAEGLAEDVRYYGAWMRDEAKKRIGHLYPKVDLPKEHGGGKATVVAWLWARTVPSPDPAFEGVPVPLVSTFWLSTKAGGKAWLKPHVEKIRKSWRFEVVTGEPPDPEAVNAGTKEGRGDFSCILSGAPMPVAYIRQMGIAGKMGARLIAVVAERKRGRCYVSATSDMESVAAVPVPDSAPTSELPEEALGFRIQNYGLRRHRDLFTARQLTALTTFSDLVLEAHEKAVADARSAGITDGPPLRDGGSGAQAYGDALALYLAFCLDKTVDGSSTLCRWMVQRDSLFNTYAKQALPMTWDFAEVNVLADCTRSLSESVAWTAESIEGSPVLLPAAPATVRMADARQSLETEAWFATDPPYYDNIGYADLSDFFYVWLRRALKDIAPSEFRTMLVPKAEELIAAPYRTNGDPSAARSFFENGLLDVFRAMHTWQVGAVPLTIFYAFKQSEADSDDDGGSAKSSTGWETFLAALNAAQFVVDGTWPVRSERAGRQRDLDSNALASSIVLVCRKRPADAATTTRGEFRRLLRKELPDALKKLQQGNIAPVDVAQASIGPGIGIFSSHKQVLEADGKPMTVRAALQLINEVLDEYLASGEGDFDADTRFAITWYEQHGWEPGPFGDAETLAKARNVSVGGVVEAGICKSAAGKVRILKRHEMRPLDYDPTKDDRPTIWEFTQHMIRNLEDDGEEGAARLLKKLGSAADATRELAYRLYNTCERKKWAEDARSYNALILAWTELEKLAAKMSDEPVPGLSKPAKGANGKKKPEKATKAPEKGQQTLFEGDD
jgi:putative DNA methylase